MAVEQQLALVLLSVGQVDHPVYHPGLRGFEGAGVEGEFSQTVPDGLHQMLPALH